MSRQIAIVGAGVAGLAAAAYARMSGFEVDVYEGHTIPGGLCTSWRIDGFLFDGCIEFLMGSGPASPFHRLWQEVGVVPRPFVDREVYSETVTASGQRVVLWADPDRLQAHLDQLAPADAALNAELCGLVRQARAARYRVDLAPELMTWRDKLAALQAMWPQRRLWTTGLGRSVRQFAGRYRTPAVREALLHAIPADLSLFSLVTVLADLANRTAGQPVGGSMQVALSMARRCTSLGVRLHYRCPVVRARVEAGRAVGLELADGRQVPADVVIAAGDLRATLDGLLDGAWPSPGHEALFRLPRVPSVCIVSLGVRGPVAPAIDAVVHRLLLDPPASVAGQLVSSLAWKSFGHDPSLAPQGKTVMSVYFDSPASAWLPLADDRPRYDAVRAELGRGVVGLLERVLPGLGARVETVDVATPLTVSRYTRNHQGHYMTFLPPLGGPPRQPPRQVPGLQQLYLAGMWVTPPGGLPNALRSGREVVQVLCRDLGVPFRAEVPAAAAAPAAGEAPAPATA